MHCFFYILYSQNIDKYYIGHTCDSLESRLAKHNAIHKGFTGQTHDWKIKYHEMYNTKLEAYAREREVKKWKSRKRIEKLFLAN